jgi:hypothetical protein
VTGTSTCPNSQIFPGTAGGGGGTGPSQGTGGSGSSHSGGGAGGGGGGGYYGGGGGGGGAADPGSGCDAFAGGGGGGGGASYTGAVSGAVVTDGVAAPDDAPAGEVIISYQVATPDATRLSAGPVLFRISPGQVVLTLRLSATLTDTVTGQRVAGQLITFTVGGRTVCTAVTGSRGWAVCRGRDAVLQALLAGHYTASFAGTPMLQPATAQGYLIKI